MKKLLLITLLCTAFYSQAQDKTGAIKTNPIGLAIGLVNLSYESALSETTSIQGTVAYASIEILETQLTGFAANVDYRMYTDQALSGFYYGPLAGYTSFTVEDESNKGTLNAFNIGAKLGWNWLLGAEDNFVIDLGLGGAYSAGNVTVDEGSNDFDLGGYDGFGPVLTFAIGYAW